MSAPLSTLIRRRMDRFGVALSALCLVHCVSGLVLVTLLGVGGGVLLDPRIHEYGLAVAIVVAALGLGIGAWRNRRYDRLALGGAGIVLMSLGLLVPHGLPEVIATMSGVSMVAGAHIRNLRHPH
ncbi:MerC family mercury resistance protein [Novosphingobium sp. FSY-8]|uniref:MerC family mercury resistance protein n=1 Tax=Novosphingobium ovatum TaxID=1908523 RepID=A0ABW9XH83_9SPHN|nr:MerC domain-containing protein [Novosphingobium ovatum]NBC37900.1 MerC family mercury resistance protein [Novosphingobium ovatum]